MILLVVVVVRLAVLVVGFVCGLWFVSCCLLVTFNLAVVTVIITVLNYFAVFVVAVCCFVACFLLLMLPLILLLSL